MIAADVLSSNDTEVQRVAKIFFNSDEIEVKDSFVTYDIFSRTYWPHFPRPLPKGFGMYCFDHANQYSLMHHPHCRAMACFFRVHGCVIMNYDMSGTLQLFIGVIKGSEKSLSCPDGFPDEATYCCLSARSNPTFANHRQSLYALFQAYCKLKKERRHHDVADRTHAILKALLGGTALGGQRVDYLWVQVLTKPLSLLIHVIQLCR